MDRRCQYHIPRQVLGCERPDYPPRIWRRCWVRSRPDANADSRANNTGITEPEPNACDAIGITESELVSISGSNPGTDSDARANNSGANPESDRDSNSDARANNSGIIEPGSNACDAIGITESVTGTVGD